MDSIFKGLLNAGMSKLNQSAHRTSGAIGFQFVSSFTPKHKEIADLLIEHGKLTTDELREASWVFGHAVFSGVIFSQVMNGSFGERKRYKGIDFNSSIPSCDANALFPMSFSCVFPLGKLEAGEDGRHETIGEVYLDEYGDIKFRRDLLDDPVLIQNFSIGALIGASAAISEERWLGIRRMLRGEKIEVVDYLGALRAQFSGTTFGHLNPEYRESDIQSEIEYDAEGQYFSLSCKIYPMFAAVN